MSTPALEVHGLSKTFSGNRVLRDVDLAFRRNTVTALLGPNGCGKSTLIKILAGFHEADQGGRIEIGGEPVSIPFQAKEMRERGLHFLHQDLALVPDMDVADNLAFADGFEGRPGWAPLHRRARIAQARSVLERFGLEISPRTEVRSLSRTDQIMVAVARAFDSDGGGDAAERIVILDEPTASLPGTSVDQVLDAVRRIKEAGGTVIYVTHRIDEVMRIADDVVVLRDGQVASQQALGDLTAEQLAELIIGSEVKRPVERTAQIGGLVLRLDEISSGRLRKISFGISSGETLGVAGLAGCGRSELARVVAGVTAPRSGAMFLDDEEISLRSPRAALDRGIAFVPPDRAELGVIGDLSVSQNLILTDLSTAWRHGFLNRRLERNEVNELIQRFDIKPPDARRRMRFLSGGNQQKAVIAKFMRLTPRLLVVDEPTQGVDIAGKQEIAGVLRGAAEDGCAVMLLSSDFDEIAELCDRVLVLNRGEMVGIFERGEIHERQLAVLTTQQQEVIAS